MLGFLLPITRDRVALRAIPGNSPGLVRALHANRCSVSKAFVFSRILRSRCIACYLCSVSHLVAIAILAVGTVLVLLGVAERIIRGRAVSWPVAEGKIDSAPIEEFKGKRHHWTVRLNYSFMVYGKRYTGRYSCRFDYEDDAQSWAHHLQGKTVLVRHSPRCLPCH